MNCRRCNLPLDAGSAAEALAAGAVDWNVCPECAAAAETANPAAFVRRLTAAHGFLELGLPHEAARELDAIEPAARRGEVPVLGLRVAVFHALERWGAMAEVCRHLATVEPSEACWPLWLATATRRTEGLPAARDILLRAMVRFPREAAISFNLACYAAQGGDLADARDCLRRAFRLEPALRAKALKDPDLVPLGQDLGGV